MCIISVHVVIFSYLFKYFFKTLEQDVIYKLTEGEDVLVKNVPNFNNKLLNSEYNNNLVKAFFQLSNNITLFNDQKLFTNLNLSNNIWWDSKLPYNLNTIRPELFKVMNLEFDNSQLFTVQDLSFLPSQASNSLKNINYNLLPIHMNINSYNHDLFTQLVSLQKSNEFLKQTRWSLKNSLISEDFIIQNNMFLNSKQLLGNSFSSVKNTDNNIWVSNFTNMVNPSHLNINKELNNHLTNFNTFEESRNFFFTRFLLFLNNKTLLPTKNFNVESSFFQKNLDYNSSVYYISQETNNRVLLNNNNLLFLNNNSVLSLPMNVKPLGFKTIDNTLESVGFFSNSSSNLVSNLTNTKSTTFNVLSINKNLN